MTEDHRAMWDSPLPPIWTFTGYRPDAAALGKHGPTTLNDGDQPQYQGVVFADGTTAVRWLTALRSVSVWADFATFFGVHGHPEYGTVIVWDGAPPPDADRIIREAYAALEVILAAERAAAPGATTDQEKVDQLDRLGLLDDPPTERPGG